MLNMPELFFRKTFVETGACFESAFNNKNCPGWTVTALEDLCLLAEKRIEYWNKRTKEWRYELLGWRLTNNENQENA